MHAVESNRPRRVLASFALFFACALATHASGLWQPMHADYSCWLRVARDWRSGAVLYRETYDNKSPWVYRWVRIIDSARPEVSCYLAESLLAAVAATLFAAALRPALPRVALVAPLLLIVWSGTNETFYGGQTVEAFALWWDVAAVSCWALAAHKGSAAWALAAGACLFLVVAFRPPAAVHVIAWIPFGVLLWRRHERGVAWRTLAGAIAGAAAMLGLFCLDAARSDFASELPHVLSRNFSYGALDRVSFGASLWAACTSVARMLLGNPVVPLFVVLTFVVWWRAPRSMPARQKAWFLAAVLWSGAALAGAWPGGRHYLHYYHLLWPALAVLAVFWLTRSWDFALARRVQGKLCLGVAAGSIAVAVLQQSYLAAKAWRDRATGQDPQTAVLEAAGFLEHASGENTPLVAHVWLDRAELYWRVPRPAPSFAIPHVLPGELFDQWAEATLADPPEFIVWDGTPWEGIDGPPSADVAKRLESLLATRYRKIKQFGDLAVYRRDTSSD